jgi:hypothetical protein
LLLSHHSSLAQEVRFFALVIGNDQYRTATLGAVKRSHQAAATTSSSATASRRHR